MNIKDFYNSVSEFYDSMISFDQALIRRTNLYRNLLNRSMKYAADLGCGTGLDSISLTKNGLKVTAFDISSLMIESAKKNASIHKCKIDFVCSSLDKISKKYYRKFDLVVSMGNTIANLRPLMLKKTVHIVHDMLKKGGMILIQVLNFDKIIKEGKRIIKISKIPNEYVVRFYDIHRHYLNFNILKFSSSNTNKYELQTTYLYPYLKSDMVNILHKAGFRKISTYGDLLMEKFTVKKSNDLIIAAYK